MADRTPQPFIIEPVSQLDQTEVNTRLTNIQADFEALFQDNANAQGFLSDDLNALLDTLDDGYLTNDGGELTIQAVPIPIADGGTNATATPTAGGAAYGTGTAYAFTSAGTTGQVLTSQGASAPTWSDVGPIDRVVETATSRTISNTYSLVVADYFEIQGTGSLLIEGDGVLAVL